MTEDKRDRLKKDLFNIAVLAVASVATWLTTLDSIQVISGWFQPDITIKVTSTTGEDLELFRAGDRIRFSLQHTRSDEIFWKFEKNGPFFPGNLDAEHVFPFDPNQQVDSRRVHKVHVIFKTPNGQYKVVSTDVLDRNKPSHDTLKASE